MTTTADNARGGSVFDLQDRKPSRRQPRGAGWQLVATLAGAALLTTLGPLTSPASAAHTALQRVAANSAHDTLDGKTVVAKCPTNKRLVGTGAEITGGDGQVVIDDLTPNAALTQVMATGHEDHGPGNTTAAGVDKAWHITAYAICARAFPGLVLAKASDPIPANPPNSNSPKSVTARCPANTSLVGTGGDMTGVLGDAGIVEIIPFATSVRVSAVEGHAGTAAAWRLTAYAICAFPPSGLQVVAGPASAFNSISPKAASVLCPGGKLATGAGARIDNGAGNVVLDDLRPGASNVLSTSYEEDHGYVPNWSIRSYAICVTA